MKTDEFKKDYGWIDSFCATNPPEKGHSGLTSDFSHPVSRNEPDGVSSGHSPNLFEDLFNE